MLGDKTHCSISYSGLYKDVTVGNKLLVDDGLLELTIESIKGNKIHCIADNTGFIGNHKGVNVPNVSINVPAVTDKDKEDLIFGCQMNVDMVAASYIRKATDVLSVRKILEANYIKKSDLIIVAAGVPVQYSGTTNMLKVEIVQ